MAENRKAMEVILAAENQKEAADVLDFAKLLTEEQKNNLETLLRGVKIGYDLATGGAAKTA